MVMGEYIEEVHFVQKNHWLIFFYTLQHSLFILF